MFLQEILTGLNYLGILAFSISGSLKAFEKKLDLLGVLVLGFSTALAGGIARDVLLGVFPPTSLREVQPPLIAILGSIITVLLYRQLRKIHMAILIADAVGLGAFTATGAEIGLEQGLNLLGTAMIASLTAVGGGVLRDLLSNEIPIVLKRDFYATPTIIGGIVFYFLAQWFGGQTSLILTSVLVTGLRLLAMIRKWELPKVGG
jgi:Predicted membrane protein